MNWNGLKSFDGRVSEQEFNKLVDVLQSLALQPGINYRITRHAGGTTILPKGKGGGSASIHPFQLIDASETVDEVTTHKIRVKYGTVEGEAPVGMSPGDDPAYVLTLSTSTGYIYLVVTAEPATGAITSRTIGIDTSIPSDTSDTFYFQIGSWSITDDVLSIAQAIGGSLAFELCGGVEATWGLV